MHDPQTRDMIATARAELARSLSRLSGAARIDAARRACEACGGSLIAPTLPWGPQEFEMSLLGILGSGPAEAGAIAEWIKAALRSADTEAGAAA